jgi:hypothetical protein
MFSGSLSRRRHQQDESDRRDSIERSGAAPFSSQRRPGSARVSIVSIAHLLDLANRLLASFSQYVGM